MGAFHLGISETDLLPWPQKLLLVPQLSRGESFQLAVVLLPTNESCS